MSCFADGPVRLARHPDFHAGRITFSYLGDIWTASETGADAHHLEINRRALRAQAFNEGRRVMKNRFYDAKMHGADWNAAKKVCEPLLQYLTDPEELHTVMMMMIGELNASHTGVSGGGGGADLQRPHTRHPGLMWSSTRAVSTTSPHLQRWPGGSRFPQDPRG